jgi:prepilin-type N-terminal cleavage/methylation domain-containing protein
MNEKGMTLIEIIISLALLSFIAIALISFLTQAFVRITDFGDNTNDVFISQRDVEDMLAEGTCSNVDTQIGFTFTDPGGGGDITVNVDGEVCNDGELQIFIP